MFDMKRILILIFLIICIRAIEIQETDSVLILDDDNFDLALSQNKFLLVKFYAPWCGHCKKLAPEFMRAAQKLKELNKDIKFGELDTTKNTNIARRYGVTGIPQIKLFLNGDQNVAADFEDKRVEDSIVAWCIKKSQPSSIALESQQQLEYLIENNKLLIVYFGKDNENFQLFLKYAISLNDIKAYHTFDSEIIASKDIKNDATIVLFKQFDERRNDYTDKEFQVEEIKNFIEKNYLAAIMEFDEDSAAKTLGEDKPILVLFHQKDDKSLFTEIEEAATELKGKIYLVTAVITEGLGKKLGEHAKITEDMIPIIRIIQLKRNDIIQYQIDGDITAKNIITLYESWHQKILQPLKTDNKKEEL